MKIITTVIFSAAIWFLAPQTIISQNANQVNEIKSNIITLFARDPLSQSFCFKDGGFGSIFQEGQVRNRCSDLNFNSYSHNGFSVGVEGGREGVIIDLGTPNELQKKYGYSETVGNGQGFASLTVKNSKVLILKDYRAKQLQELYDSDLLFRSQDKSFSSTAVKLGHVYLLRLIDKYDKSFELLVKILVIAYIPDESVTIRWHVLSNEIKPEN